MSAHRVLPITIALSTAVARLVARAQTAASEACSAGAPESGDLAGFLRLLGQ